MSVESAHRKDEMRTTKFSTPLATPLGWTPRDAGGANASHLVHSRPLDTLETFFKLVTDAGKPIDREHWAVSLALKLNVLDLSLPDAAPYIRRAWQLVGRLQPTLTASVKEWPDAEDSAATADTTKIRTNILTVESSDVEAWTSRTFFIRHEEAAGTQGVESSTYQLFSKALQTGTATCHWIPTSKEVVVRAAHWRVDGIGMLMLGHNFMTALTSVLSQGLGLQIEDYSCYPLRGSYSRSLDDMVKSYTDEASTPEHLKIAADGIIAEFVKRVPSIALPTRPGSETAVPGDSGRETVTLDAAKTASVVAACKSRGISIPSAVHAAVVRVTASFPQHPLAKSYASFFPADLRRHLPQPYNSTEYAVGCLCSGLPVCISDVLEKSFDEIAGEVSAAYARDLSHLAVDDQGQPLGMLDLVAPYVRRTTKLFTTPPPPELPPVQSPDLSSLGLVEKYIQRQYSYSFDRKSASPQAGPIGVERQAGEDQRIVEVANLWLGTQMLPRTLQCHFWTFRDEMTIQGCYNISFYTRAFIKEVLSRIQEELLTGLGIV